MWHVCGCCWLKVVVIIAGLKMTGGGCVPLIPYLISRSRGEALNPKHTHSLNHSLTNVSTYSQRLMQLYSTLCSLPKTLLRPMQLVRFQPNRLKRTLTCFFLMIVYPNFCVAWLQIYAFCKFTARWKKKHTTLFFFTVVSNFCFPCVYFYDRVVCSSCCCSEAI